MDVKSKQQWSEEETQCFLALWSSTEVQGKLEGASRTKPIFESIQREMAAAGYERSLEQLINKLKKLKKDYRDQKKKLGRSGSGRPKKSPHFELLDSVLGYRPSNQAAGALNSASAMMDSMIDESVVQTADTDPELSTLDQEALLPRSLVYGSPAPSCSSSSSSRTKSRKRKQDTTANLLEYLERSEERLLERENKRDHDLATAMLQNINRMDQNTQTLLGLMGRMVSVLEGLSKK